MHLYLVPIVPTEQPSPTPESAGEASWHDLARARVWRYLRFLGCPADLADDFTQDTLLAALRTFPDCNPPAAWLCTTARNELRMHHRRSGRVVNDLDALHAQWIEVAEPDGGEATLLALQHCLGELPERSRRALQLRYGNGAERTDIGRELGLGDEGVKSLLARLRGSLAACVQRRLNEKS